MTKIQAEIFIENCLTVHVLADYLTADSDCRLGIYPNGSVYVGDYVGNERPPSRLPILTAKCRGMGNLDMTWFRSGSDDQGMPDKDCVRACCEDGDVSEYMEDLTQKLIESLRD